MDGNWLLWVQCCWVESIGIGSDFVPIICQYDHVQAVRFMMKILSFTSANALSWDCYQCFYSALLSVSYPAISHTII